MSEPKSPSSSTARRVQSFVRNFFTTPHGPQPYSPQTLALQPRTRDAKVARSVCPYCAVGCGQLIYHKDGKIVDIEGDPESPISRGTLCPKGAATFQYVVNPSRVTHCLYRRPYSAEWERVPLEWAMEQIAQRIKQTRDDTFVRELPDGQLVNMCLNIACLGGATLEVEENYLIKKLLNGGLGILSIENQARI